MKHAVYKQYVLCESTMKVEIQPKHQSQIAALSNYYGSSQLCSSVMSRLVRTYPSVDPVETYDTICCGTLDPSHQSRPNMQPITSRASIGNLSFLARSGLHCRYRRSYAKDAGPGTPIAEPTSCGNLEKYAG